MFGGIMIVTKNYICYEMMGKSLKMYIWRHIHDICFGECDIKDRTQKRRHEMPQPRANAHEGRREGPACPLRPWAVRTRGALAGALWRVRERPRGRQKLAISRGVM